MGCYFILRRRAISIRSPTSTNRSKGLRMVEANDLSDYEKIRLANIQKNAEFLRSIGLCTQADNCVQGFQALVVKPVKSKHSVRKPRPSREDEVHTPPSPTRKSSRLRKQLASDALADDYIDKDLDDGDDNATIKKPKSIVSSELLKIDYDSFPEVSEGLDDFEFKTYVFLRAWRAKKCKELDLEAYKLFQNKTLCELIRRRRNDVTWAKDDMNDFEKIAKDLRECWGIGPSKARQDGFGFDILEQMENIEVIENLMNSRLLCGSDDTGCVESTTPDTEGAAE